MQEQHNTSLPENAYRELKAGEQYEPVMPTNSKPREVTPYSVIMGLVLAIINYPLYNRILGARRKKYAGKIIELSDSIMKG